MTDKKKMNKISLTLQEFWAFAQSLSDDWYFEGDEGYVDDEFWEGPGHFDPSDKITVERGVIAICYQGDNPDRNKDFLEFIDEFIKWKTGITYEFVILEVPKGKVAEVKKLVQSYLEKN